MPNRLRRACSEASAGDLHSVEWAGDPVIMRRGPAKGKWFSVEMQLDVLAN
jgi:hypothetical protein